MTYNGWTNKPTWLLYTWLTNDHDSYHEVREQARNALETDNPKQTLAVVLRDNAQAMLPAQSGLDVDLLGYAIAEIDFVTVADALLEEERQ